MPNMGGAMPMPDLAAAALKLGIAEEVLKAAFRTAMPPDLVLAASKLGVTEAALKDALGLNG